MPDPVVAEDMLVRTKSPAQIRRMFDAVAPTYDFLNHLLSLNIDKRWRRFAARKLMTPDMQLVLDVCSGTGDLALALSEQAFQTGTECNVVSTDFTPSMVALAKKKSNVLFPAVADTLRLPFRDSTFDLVTVAFGIRNVADLAGGLGEMSRVCKPGGRIAVLEFSHPRNPLFRGAYNFYFFRVLPWIGRVISGSRAYLYLPKSVSKFPDSPEFAKIMERAAGSTTEVHRLSGGIASLYIATVRK